MNSTPTQPQKTCFVIMGFGIKTDYRTGKEIDLDKTYKTIIKPAFEDLGFLCFRADEIKHSGIIDIPMYQNIVKADFVLADISTLNANVLYELGVRHAVKKFSTMIIAEKQLLFPFDLSHISIDSYEHLGKAIDYDEVLRFREVIKEKVIKLMATPETDSPLYSLLPDLNTPSFTAAEVRGIEREIRDETSLSDILITAEEKKNEGKFNEARTLLEDASKAYPSNEFIIQRMTLMIYKSKMPDPLTALNDAFNVLKKLSPDKTTDPETLGLAGAIYKRLYEETGNIADLEQSLWFYTRGFYVKQDYYNGINVAYLYTLKATLSDNQMEAFANYGQGIEIRKKVIAICKSLQAIPGFRSRDDQEWIFLTLAEAAVGGGFQAEEEAVYLELFENNPHSSFAMGSYLDQKLKLVGLMDKFRQRWNIASL